MQPQRRVHPDLRDRDEFLVGHRVDDLAHAVHRVVGVAAFLVAADEVLDGVLAVPVLDHEVDQSQFVHAAGGHQLAAHDDALGDVRAQAPDQEAVGAHAGDQVEQHLGQAELGALLGDHDVARDRRLESAAQRVALHQRDRRHRLFEADAVGVQDVDAGLGVAEQPFAVAVADHPGEQLQVAPQVEHARVRCWPGSCSGWAATRRRCPGPG